MNIKNKSIETAIQKLGSMRALAEAVGVSHVAVFGWLNGGGIKARYILKIAQATDNEVTVFDLLNSLAELEENK